MLVPPLVAQAQIALPYRGPTIGAPASTPARGVTVNASAQTRIPADSATVTLQLASADRAMILDAKRVQPIVDALVRMGADPNSVRLPPNFAAPGAASAASVTATFAHPTAEEMQQGIVTVGTAVAGVKDVMLNGAQVMLRARHCSAAFERVRKDAIERAHAKAISIARDLNVGLGGALAVSAFDQSSADGSCGSMYYLNGFTQMGSPQTPEQYVTIPVTATVTITYAIK
jgi:uncharacterized protein YggE